MATWQGLMLKGDCAELPNPTVDHSAVGIIDDGTAGEALAIGDLCYFKSDGKFWKCDADAETTSKGLLALATAAIAADALGVFLFYGKYRDDSWAWATIGAELFISVTPGNPTATKPSGTGDIVRIVAHVVTADILFFNPSQTYLELS